MRTLALVLGMFGGFVGVYFAQLLVTGTALFGTLASAFGGRNAEQPLYWGLAALGCYTLGIIGGSLALQRPGIAAVLMIAAALGGAAATIAVLPAATNVLTPSATASPRAFAPTPEAPATPLTTQSYVALGVVFGGPFLLLVAGILAATEPREPQNSEGEGSLVPTGRRRFVPAQPEDPSFNALIVASLARHPAVEPVATPTPLRATLPATVTDYQAFHSERSGQLATQGPQPLLSDPGMYGQSLGQVSPTSTFAVLGETSLYYFVRVANHLEAWLPKKIVRVSG